MLDEALTGRYRPHGNPEDADVILAPAFGRSPDGRGVSNVALAKFAVAQAERLQIGIYAQYGVANVIEDLGKKDLLIGRADPRNEQEEKYINSDNVLARVAAELNDKNVMVVAHASHVPRFDAQAMRHGLATIVPEGLPRTWGWDNVIQEVHCSSPITWAVREPLVLLHGKLTGKF